MIRLARLVDRPAARPAQDVRGRRSRSRSGRPTPRSAKARFALYGTNTYPDATFTLRLAFGAVKGYEEDGKQVPPWTTLRRPVRACRASTTTSRPFDLPQRWLERKDKLNLKTPFNFVSHGRHHRRQLRQPGGQPRRRGRRASSSTATSSRWCSTSSTPRTRPAPCRSTPAAIIEALRKVYDADRIVKELGGTPRAGKSRGKSK